jgi:hypothetical protein
MHVGSGLDTVRNSGPGHWLGHRLAGYLNRPRARYRTFSVHGCSTLERFLQPGDVLLVEGELRISSVIKYLTQSTWSHAALYVGDALLTPPDGCGGMLVEADIEQGVIAVPVGKYARLNTRICRPVGLDAIDRRRVVQFMVSSLGKGYDLDNVIDLVRYLVPLHAPARYRRRLLALGSGATRSCPGSSRSKAAPMAAGHGPRSCTSGTTACSCRGISTSRPISTSSSRPWPLASTTRRSSGAMSIHRKSVRAGSRRTAGQLDVKQRVPPCVLAASHRPTG